MERKAVLPYVIVEVGYEGIEEIIWSTEDPEEAARVVKELREAVNEFYELWEQGLEEAKKRAGIGGLTEEELGGLLRKGEIEREVIWEMERVEAERAIQKVIEKYQERELFPVYRKVIENARWTNPDRICVQRFDIEERGFRCYCDDLGVGIGREILY